MPVFTVALDCTKNRTITLNERISLGGLSSEVACALNIGLKEKIRRVQ